MSSEIFRSLVGVGILVLIGFCFSYNRKAISWRTVVAALVVQGAIGAFVLFNAHGITILSGIATAGTKSYLASHAHALHGAGARHVLAYAQVNGTRHALLVAAFFPLITAFIALVFVKNYQVDDDGLTVPAA